MSDFRDFLAGSQQDDTPPPADFRSYLANGHPADQTSKAIAVPEAPKPPLDVSGLSLENYGRAGAEITGHLATGLVAPLAGGAASYLGRFLPGGDWERAQDWADKTQKAITDLAPEVKTDYGKAVTGGMDYVGQKISEAGSYLGGKTIELTGSPTLASGVDATAQVAAGALAGRAVGHIVRAPVEDIAKPSPVTDTARPSGIVAGAEPPKVIKPPSGQRVVAPIQQPITAEAVPQSLPVDPKVAAQASLADAVKNTPDTVVKPEVELPAEPTVKATDEGSAAPTAEQSDNAAVLARVGHDTARTSALTGDAAATVFENDIAKRNPEIDPNAAIMQQQIAHENAATTGFADKIASETGGTVGTDQSARYARGSAIDDAWSKLQDWHKAVIKNLYDTAQERLGNTPVQLSEFSKYTPDLTKLPGTQDAVAFKSSMDNVARQLQIIDKDGNALPATASQAEAMRQWLNKDHGPDVWEFVKGAKEALDNDVTSAAGEDVFSAARAAHALAQKTLYNNKELARAFQEDSKGNRATKLENLPDAIARTSVDSHAHFVNVMSNMPKGLEGVGAQALREMAAHYASNLADKGRNSTPGGRWKYRDASKYIADNNMKLSQVFNKDGIGMIHDLDKAGKLTAMDRTYVGSAAQHENFAISSGLKVLPKAAGLAGGAIGAIMHEPVGGALAGQTAGEWMAKKGQSIVQRKAINKSIVPLR